MSNSIQAVKDKLRNISREKNIDFNSVMRFYMYDRFVERLSKSKYKDNFILKGGFYLSKLFGLDNRSTMDIDTAIRKTNLSLENVIKMITEIINIDVDDNVKFEIEKTESIRDEDEYGGLRITIKFTLENIIDTLGTAKELGFRTNFTYIVGLEDLETIKRNFEKMIHYINSFPIINIFQEHKYHKGIRHEIANNMEYYLQARKIMEEIFLPTEMRPRPWED